MFSVEKPKRHFGLLFSLFLLAVLLFGISAFSDNAMDSNRANERQLLQNAISRSITQCYALEGAYPANLNYLCENYGLTYDPEHFFVDYHYIASNLRPDVTIIERD